MSNGMTQGDDDQRNKGIVFFIDEEQFRSTTEKVTVRTLLVDYAKEDPTKTTLVEKRGKEQIKLTNLDEVIELKDGMKFVVFHNTPTTVS